MSSITNEENNNITILNFTFNEGEAQFKKGRFEISNLDLSDSEGELDVTYDEVKAYFDDELYTGGIGTWAVNNVSANFLFDSVLNSYLHDDHLAYKEFKGFEVFEPIAKLKEYKDGLLMKFPQYKWGIRMYEIDLATPESRYYHCDDEYLLLGLKGEVETDMEPFWSSAFYDEMCSILKEETECLYKSADVDKLVEEYNGKEGFLEEFDDSEE